MISSWLFWMAHAWTKKNPAGVARGMFYFSDLDYKDDVYDLVKSSFEGDMGLQLVEFFDRKFAERLFGLEFIEDIAFLLEERIGLNKVFSKPAASPSPAGAAAAPVSTPSGKTSPQGTPPAPQPPLAAPPDEEKYLDFDLAISPTGHVVASSKEEGDVPADISTEVPDDIQLALELIDQNKATEKISKR